MEDDVDETLLVDNLGLSDEVRHACFAPAAALNLCVRTHQSLSESISPLIGVSSPSTPVSLQCCDTLLMPCQVVRALKRRGIAALFPIQTMVLRPAMEGKDLTARAKTGSGKTLAFALPVVESLLAEDQDRKTRKTPGRTPRCGQQQQQHSGVTVSEWG